jgi:hypothetical protein
LDYGYLWWVTPPGTDPAYTAAGLYGQLVLVVSTRPFPPSPSPEGLLSIVKTDILPRL